MRLDLVLGSTTMHMRIYETGVLSLPPREYFPRTPFVQQYISIYSGPSDIA